MERVKHWYIDKIIEEKTLHTAGSSAVNDITLETEEKRKEKKKLFQTGYLCLVIQLSRNPVEQDFDY